MNNLNIFKLYKIKKTNIFKLNQKKNIYLQ